MRPDEIGLGIVRLCLCVQDILLGQAVERLTRCLWGASLWGKLVWVQHRIIVFGFHVLAICLVRLVPFALKGVVYINSVQHLISELYFVAGYSLLIHVFIQVIHGHILSVGVLTAVADL